MAKSQSEQVWQEELPAANFTYVRDSAEEKALVRKIDKRIVSCFSPLSQSTDR